MAKPVASSDLVVAVQKLVEGIDTGLKDEAHRLHLGRWLIRKGEYACWLYVDRSLVQPVTRWTSHYSSLESRSGQEISVCLQRPQFVTLKRNPRRSLFSPERTPQLNLVTFVMSVLYLYLLPLIKGQMADPTFTG